MEKFFLIDGSSFIFRAFYGIPPMFRSDGTPTNAVFGFCSMLLRLISKRKHGRYAIVADSGSQTFRNDLYSAYKANRIETPEELKPQFDLIKEAVEAFSLPSIAMKGFEADDVIASYAREAHEKGHAVEIVSSDKDLMQLVNHTVYMYDAMKDKEIHSSDVMERFGIRPNQVVDLQAMMGDASDNVPGIKGIGPKTASKLLQEHETLEGIYANIQKVNPAGLQKKLLDDREMAFLSKRLVKLDEYVPNLPELDSIQEAQIDLEKLRRFFEKMEFRQLAPRLDSLNGGSKRESKYSGTRRVETSIEAGIFSEKFKKEKRIAMSLGEKGCAFYTPSLGCVYFDFPQKDGDLFSSRPSFFNQMEVLFSEKSIDKIVYDTKAVFHVLKRDDFDCQDIQTLGYDLLGEGDWKKLVKHFHLPPSPLFQEDLDQVGFEAYANWMLFEQLEKILKEDEKRKKLYQEIDLPLASVLYRMERNGICLDK
ncbi:MAG: hypothetical protein JXR30_04200 [Alphaproteobacteria bacterium]|nr:hypothetical protein [Alphaproteobacteria bacterium]